MTKPGKPFDSIFLSFISNTILNMIQEIVKINDPEIAVRFFTLGIYPGKFIELIRRAPFGGAYYVQVGQSFFVLRKKEWEALETKEART